MSYEPAKVITYKVNSLLGNSAWIAYISPSEVIQVGLGDTRELALENLALTLSQKLDIIINLRKGLE